MQVWTQWQSEVMTFLQGDFEEELRHTHVGGIEWSSYRDSCVQAEWSPRRRRSACHSRPDLSQVI
jgi:hypothetical protein